MSRLFAIGLEVEEVAVGKLLRVLDAMPGVAKINLNLSGQKRGEIEGEATEEGLKALPAPTMINGQRKTRAKFDPKRGHCSDVIANALKDGETSFRNLGAFIERYGFKAISAASTLNTMRERGYAKRLGDGLWALTPAGRKHFFKGNNKPQPTSRGTDPRKGVVDNSKGARRIVLDCLKEGKKSSTELKKAFTDHGMSEKNIGGVVYKMKTENQPLISSYNGVYSLTPQGTAEINRIIKSKQSTSSESQVEAFQAAE